MRFIRFVLVAVIATLLLGAFGGAVGGLIGYAVPSSLNVMFGVGANQTQTDPAFSRAVGEDKTLSIEVQKQRGMTGVGAALGAAWGLILGLAIGLIIAVVDQIVLLIRAAVDSRRPPASPALKPRAA